MNSILNHVYNNNIDNINNTIYINTIVYTVVFINVNNDVERSVKNMKANILLTEALTEIQNLNAGENFLVKDLFKGYLWNRIPINERLRLGMLFLNEIEKDASIGVVKVSKTGSGQQKYTKIK